MTENYKSIVTATWVEFVAELKRTSKEGKQNPLRLLYQHNFFKAVMVNGKNEVFAEALDQITGSEVEVLKCIDMLLESANVKSADDAPTTAKPQTLTQTPSVVGETWIEKRDNAVEVSVVKPKPYRAKRGSKGSQQ